MSKKQLDNQTTISKVVIDKKMKELAKKLMGAKNEYFQVLVLYEIVEILEAELLQSCEMLVDLQDNLSDESELHIIATENQINLLSSLIEKVQKLIKLATPKALIIQQAMINSNVPLSGKIQELI